MYNSKLKTKPIESAQKLYSLLDTIQNQEELNAQQQIALLQDVKMLKKIMSMLSDAESLDDWRSIWQTVLLAKRNFGGYVGNELGQKLTWSMEALFQDIFNSYSETNKSKPT